MGDKQSIANSAIEARAKSLNWLGGPVGSTSPKADYFYRNYQHASLYVFVNPDNTTAGVFFLIGDIRDHYNAVGGGFGYPLNDETVTSDGAGRFNRFSNNTVIYWSPSTGAHAVYGVILEKWASLGYENGALGYPLTDEESYGTRAGRYNDFQKGSINFSPKTGACAHIGPLPTSIKLGQEITYPSGVALGGWVNIEMDSDGTVGFSGDFHDSGAVSYDFSVACAVKDADMVVYTFGMSGEVHGTFERGSRDSGWNKKTKNNEISENWRSLVALNTLTTARSWSYNLPDLLKTVTAAIAVAGDVIALF